MEINSKKRSRRAGQAALETVLVILPLFAVLMAVLDFSVAIFVMDTFEYAARMGVRSAVLQSAGSTGHQDDMIRQAVRDNSLGFLSNKTNVPDSQLPINYYKLDTTTNTWVSAGSGTNSNASGNLIKVGVSAFSWAWMLSGSWGCADALKRSGPNACAHYSGLSINAASADVMQSCPLAGCPTR
jgi:Flp pilus assembly protein TadG